MPLKDSPRLSLVRSSAGPAGMAQTYPTKPVRIIVPFAPGGGSDFIARFMAQRLTASARLAGDRREQARRGRRASASSRASSPPADGYTLVLIASSYTVNPSVYKLSFDPVTRHHAGRAAVAGPAAGGRQSLGAGEDGQGPDRAGEGEARRAQLRLARAGQRDPHGAPSYFDSMAGIRMNHIPYKGTGPALTDTISGQTSVLFSSTATALPHVKSGRLKAIAVTTAKAHPGAARRADHRRVGPAGLRRRRSGTA